MELSEFLNRPAEEPVETVEQEPEEVDVQRAVVESLAADKAEQDEKIASLQATCEALQKELDAVKAEDKVLKDQSAPVLKEREDLRALVKKMKEELANVGDLLLKNKEGEASNQIALLDRSVELDDRFPGETREHVLEVIREARDAAEKNGRCRRAQVLEAVLVANEPSGELAKRRAELDKLFADNANIINGIVIEELEKRGLSHKNGENYLLPSEILARNY